MPNGPVSDYVREITMLMVDRGEASLADIVRQGWYSLRSAQRFRRSWIDNGHKLPPPKLWERRGRPLKVTALALRQLRGLLERDTSMVLYELRRALASSGYGLYSKSTLSRTLKRMGLRRHKMNKYATQRSEAERLDYRLEIGQFDPQQLVFVDESGVDEHTRQRVYGRSLIGRRAYKGYRLGKGKRLSVLPAISLGSGPYAIMFKDKTFTGDDFYTYLKDYLLPTMNPFPEPRSVIVCDNASQHHMSCVKNLVDFYGECARRSRSWTAVFGSKTRGGRWRGRRW